MSIKHITRSESYEIVCQKGDCCATCEYWMNDNQYKGICVCPKCRPRTTQGDWGCEHHKGIKAEKSTQFSSSLDVSAAIIPSLSAEGRSILFAKTKEEAYVAF